MGSQIVVGGDLDVKSIRALRIISIEDAAGLDGNMYAASIMFDLAGGDTTYLAFETPPDKDIVWFSDSVRSDVNYVRYELYENAVFTGVIDQEVINVNRQSKNVNSTKLYNSVTDVDLVGAIRLDVDATLGGDGVGGTSSGSATESKKGLRLARGTKYIIALENVDSRSATVTVHSTFIETNLAE